MTHPTKNPSAVALGSIPSSHRLSPFEEGVLCFVVLRKYQGTGTPVLILHEAKADNFGYGAFRTWTTRTSATMQRQDHAAALGSLGGNRNTEAQRKARAANVAAINARRVAKALVKRK